MAFQHFAEYSYCHAIPPHAPLPSNATFLSPPTPLLPTHEPSKYSLCKKKTVFTILRIMFFSFLLISTYRFQWRSHLNKNKISLVPCHWAMLKQVISRLSILFAHSTLVYNKVPRFIFYEVVYCEYPSPTSHPNKESHIKWTLTLCIAFPREIHCIIPS